MTDDELFDAEATKKVANRSVVTAVLAFLGGWGGSISPFPAVIVIPFLVIAIVVGVSAIRTLSHPEARVIGGVRHLGIVLAALGCLGAGWGLVVRVLVLLHGT